MGLEIDVTGKDNGYFPRKDSPIVGMYMPDAIAGFVGKDGKQYYVMANEGDDRDDFIEGEESIRLAKWKVELDGKSFLMPKNLLANNGSALKLENQWVEWGYRW